MKLALVGAEWEENLSLRYLAAAAAEAGHQPAIVAFDEASQVQAVAARLVLGGYTFVGLSLAFQHRAREFGDLARVMRDLGYEGHICLGGHVAAPAWREVLDDLPTVDSIIRHDGEVTLVKLLEVLDQPERWRSVHGVCCRDEEGSPVRAEDRRQPDDLDALPFPVRDRPHAEHVGLRFAPMAGSRGCYGNCAYCCINSWHRESTGKRLRFRSTANMAEEMAQLYHQRDVRIFCFHDDNFFMPRPKNTIARLESLREELDRRDVGRVGMVGKCRPDQVDTEMLRVARRCGVFRMYLGVENGSDAGLSHLNRLHDVASCRRALELFREAGMFACFNILLFEPDTRFDDLWGNLEFLRGTVDFPSNFCRAEVYSGSALQGRLKEQGRLRGGYLGYSYEIQDRRVELAFRLSAICFSVRNFSSDGVANTNTGMGYEGAVLRHFHGSPGAALADEVDSLVLEVNQDTVARLEALLRFARDCDPEDHDTACDFAEDLATRINYRDLELGARQDALRRRIKEFGNMEQKTRI